MGGNLLKVWNLPEKRLTTEEYSRIGYELVSKLKNDLAINWPINGHLIDIAPCVRTKETHGDLDIIIGKYDDKYVRMQWNGTEDFNVYLEQEFGYKPFKNSNTYSFPFEGFQVDVTFYPAQEFQSAVNYSSWGDLGNLMGRVYHKLGLHYGHAGLQYWVREGLFRENVEWSDSDHIIDKFVLTRNMPLICAMGGFDYTRWFQGFDTEEDVFRFIADSFFFKKELFALENLNHTNRTRNRKRGMYMRFIKWVEDNQPEDGPGELPSKKDFSIYLQCKFPELRTRIDECRFDYKLKEIVSNKISGRTVIEYLGQIDGKIIGMIVERIKQKYDVSSLIMMTSRETENEIRKQYNILT